MAGKLRVGQKVRLPNGVEAFVRYVGVTDFKEGEWVGLELDEPSGKNNGSVNGTVYFECEDNYGMFMRPLPTITVLEQPKAPVKSLSTRKSAIASPPAARAASSSHTTMPARSRLSVAAVPASRTSTAAGVTSSTTAKRIANGASTTPATRSSVTSALASRTSRMSLASARSASPQKVSAATSNTARPSVAARAAIRSPAIASPRSGSAVSRVMSPDKAVESPPSKPRLATATASSSVARSVTQQNMELEELKTKVQFLEKKLSEERENLRKASGLEEKQSHYENVIQKLHTKCQTFHQENGELKKETKSLSERLEILESSQAEHESVLELAALDREMAEEKAESFKTELDAVRARIEEMELENEILRDENEELGKDMSPEERTSQGWLQMQRENERLRQALLRLRDLSREESGALKDEIKLLEEDTKDLPMFKEQSEEARARVLEIEADNEDLREQLDAALGAESMIEQLTEQNLSLGEQMQELHRTIEHLQDLQELNDELEDNHVEHERQLQEVIDWRETQINEMASQTAKQEEELVDREYTIAKFRELVVAMQSDLEDMQASKEISELEAQNLEHSSRAILDMNRQLQATASSATVKAIDMELGRLQANQASDELEIVQLFLPETLNSERDSIQAYLKFKRLAFKARLVHGLIKQRINVSNLTSDSLSSYAICGILDMLGWLSANAQRFVAFFENSELDQFSKLQATLPEVVPVEKTLDACLDSLKRNDLREDLLSDGLQRSIAVLKHLSETHIKTDLQSFADEVLMRVMIVQSNLENTATILSSAKTDILRYTSPSIAQDDESQSFESNSEATLVALRSAKVVASKLHNVLREMASRQLTLDMEFREDFEKCNERSLALFDYFQALSKTIDSLLHREADDAADFSSVVAAMQRSSSDYFKVRQTNVFAPAINNLKGLSDLLISLSNSASKLDQLIEFEKLPEPWLQWSNTVKDRNAISAIAEEEIKNLRRDFQERATALKLRQQELHEAKMKIELLDQRNKEAHKKADRIVELEHEVSAAADRQKTFDKAMERQLAISQGLQEERDRWKNQASLASAERGPALKDRAAVTADDRPIGTSVEVSNFKAEIAALTDTNIFLRLQCRRSRLEEDAKAHSWLSTPLMPTESQSMQAKRAQQALYRAVLSNIARLPAAAQPFSLPDGAPTRSAQRSEITRGRKPVTANAQLIEQEAHWLSAWEPVAAEWKTHAIQPLTIAGL